MIRMEPVRRNPRSHCSPSRSRIDQRQTGWEWSGACDVSHLRLALLAPPSRPDRASWVAAVRSRPLAALLVVACSGSSARVAAPEPTRDGTASAASAPTPGADCRDRGIAAIGIDPVAFSPAPAVHPVSPDAPGRAAFATLGAWYADPLKYPDVTRLVADLSGRDAARGGQRQAGADRRLDALLVHLARALAENARGDPALPIVEALLDEPLVECEAAALAILRRQPTSAGDELLAELLASRATRSHAALVEAIALAQARGLAGPAIARLVDHPHPGVRASARSASGRKGKVATASPDATRAAWDAFRVGASRVEEAQFLAARLRQMTATVEAARRRELLAGDRSGAACLHDPALL